MSVIPARTIRLKIVTGGDVGNTDVVDAATGERLVFALPDGTVALYQWHLLFDPTSGGLGCVRLDLRDVPVEAPGVTTPVEMYGVSGKPRPAEVEHAVSDAAAD